MKSKPCARWTVSGIKAAEWIPTFSVCIGADISEVLGGGAVVQYYFSPTPPFIKVLTAGVQSVACPNNAEYLCLLI